MYFNIWISTFLQKFGQFPQFFPTILQKISKNSLVTLATWPGVINEWEMRRYLPSLSLHLEPNDSSFCIDKQPFLGEGEGKGDQREKKIQKRIFSSLPKKVAS